MQRNWLEEADQNLREFEVTYFKSHIFLFLTSVFFMRIASWLNLQEPMPWESSWLWMVLGHGWSGTLIFRAMLLIFSWLFCRGVMLLLDIVGVSLRRY